MRRGDCLRWCVCMCFMNIADIVDSGTRPRLEPQSLIPWAEALSSRLSHRLISCLLFQGIYSSHVSPLRCGSNVSFLFWKRGLILCFTPKKYLKTYAGFWAASSSLECNINNTDLRSSQKKTVGFFVGKNNFRGAERYESVVEKVR